VELGSTDQQIDIIGDVVNVSTPKKKQMLCIAAA